MTKAQELRSKSPDELKTLVITLKKELFNLRFQVVSGENANTARFSQVKKDIARAKTLLNTPKSSIVVKRNSKKTVAGE